MKKKQIFIAVLLIATAFSFRKPGADRTPGTPAAPSVSLVKIDPSTFVGDVGYLTTAPITSKASAEALLSIDAEIKNNEGKTIYLDKITIEITGNGKNITKTFEPDADGKDTIKAGKSYSWQNSRKYHELGDVIKFSAPYPNKITIKFFFDDFSSPMTVTKNLKGYFNTATGGAYAFPAKWLQQMDSYIDAGVQKFAAIFIMKPGLPNQQPAYFAAKA